MTSQVINGSEVAPIFSISQNLFFSGQPAANQIVAQFTASQGSKPKGLLAPGLPFIYCVARCNTNASVPTVFQLWYNGTAGTLVGTVTFTPGVDYASWAYTYSGSFTFDQGNCLTVVAPSTPDATLSDLSFFFQLLAD
jgi:hypothetical protein